MGSRLESYKGDLDGVKVEQGEAIKEGEKDVDEYKQIEAILDGIDKGNVDDEVSSHIDAAKEQSKEAAREDLETNVRSRLDSANQEAFTISDEATTLEQGDREAADQFSQAASVSDFGRSASEGEAVANEQAGEAADLASEARESADHSQAELDALTSSL